MTPFRHCFTDITLGRRKPTPGAIAPVERSGDLMALPWQPGIVHLLLLLLAALFLAGGCRCTDDPKPKPLRVGLLTWPPYELAVLAHQRGYLASADIRLVDYRSPAEVSRAFRHGSVDAVALTTQYLVQLEAEYPGNVAVFAISVSHGGDSVLARETGSLAGKRVGLEASPLGPYILDRALEAEGLSRTDVTLVPTDVPYLEEAYRDGEVDAVAVYEPLRSRLLAMGAVEVFDSTQIPGEIVDVLIVRQETLTEKREELRTLVDGWLRAREDFLSDPETAAELLSPREHLQPEEFVAAMRGAILPDRARNHELLSIQLRETIRTVVEHSLETGLIEESVDLSQAFDASLVAAP